MKLNSISTIPALLLVGIASSHLSAQTQPRIHRPVDESRVVVLKGGTHPLAQPQFDRGAAPPSLPMDHMALLLKRSAEQQAALDVLIEELHDSSSPNYHRWLTPGAFGREFGPAQEDVDTVTSWLVSQGFQVDDVATGRTMIQFSGTAEGVKNAFHTEIHKFVVNGAEHWANATDPEIPEALAPVIDGFASLHDFHARPLAQAVAPQTAGDGEPVPQEDSVNGSHNLSPADYAVIYNIESLNNQGITGAGTTIAVLGQTSIDIQDVRDFRRVFGLPNNDPILVPNGSISSTPTGDLMEALLDISWSGAIAPNATVQYVYSQSTSTTDGVFLSAEYVVNQNKADVMTLSYSACEADLQRAKSYNAVAQQAAAQGISFMVAAGDGGSADCDVPSKVEVSSHGFAVNLMASTPYVTAVGGTQFNENANPGKYWSGQNSSVYGSALSYMPEDVWNQSCPAGQAGCTANIWAGGGGASTLYSKPSWQSGVAGIPNDGHRDLPDVSLTAAGHDPYLICMNQGCLGSKTSFTPLMGTSAAAPSFAGIIALAKQKAGSRLGLVNTVLYALASQETLSVCNGSSTASAPAATCVFHDVTVGNNAVPGETGYGISSEKYAAGTGYDLASGLGSVNAFNLVNLWNTGKFAPTATALTISPDNIPAGGSATVDVTVSPRSGSGKPTGKVALVSSTGQTLSTLELVAGMGVATLTGWPSGTYTVTGEYSGDGTYAPSNSNAVTVTVAAPKSAPLSIASISPGALRAGQATTMTIDGTGFQSGLAAFIWIEGTYYKMNVTSLTSTQVKFSVTMGGPGPYTAYVVIENPDSSTADAPFQVTN